MHEVIRVRNSDMSTTASTTPDTQRQQKGFRPQHNTLDVATFQNPGPEFRGAPFWGWNGDLDRARLFEQIDVFEKMGMGGAHLHPRTGMSTPYLGEEFMSIVRDCADHAERHGMLTWLYDEDRWPSGFAGGLVTRDPALRQRHLLLTRRRCAPGETRMCPTHHGPLLPQTQRTFVAAWSMTFNGDGELQETTRIDESDDAPPDQVALYAYLEVVPPWAWFNNYQYLDTLNPKAVAKFIEVTHERYAEVLGDRLGTTIPAIFTDEPLFRLMDRPVDHRADDDLRVSWTDDLPETYAQHFGEDLLDVLPAVLYDRTDGSHFQTRWRFREHHTQRFSDAFAGQVGRWCEEHGIAMSGHMMAEGHLAYQSAWVGEVMRSLYHFQIPGIDMLCDFQELLTAKQAQSIARQRSRQGMLSELYGVTNWDFPFASHLRQGNWQAALGVTVRVPHLTWYSMAGEAKRDYPASIGQHSPWWPEYRVVEDHFARLGVALETGRPRCRVAMLHAIESYWIADGPRRKWADTQADLEAAMREPLQWLIEGLIDVDLIAESLLPQQGGGCEGGRLHVGAMRYEVVIVPPLLTMRRSTLQRLAAFADAGGNVIWLGDPPEMVDALPSDDAMSLAQQTLRCGMQRGPLLAKLEPWRDVELRTDAGELAEKVMHQIREEDDGSRIVFLCNAAHEQDLEQADLHLAGRWCLAAMNTADGSSAPLGEKWEGGSTIATVDLPVGGHLLLRLRPGEAATTPRPRQEWREVGRLTDPVPVTLHEPNVLLLDRAAWRLDDGDWQAQEEILRLDNRAREACGLPHRHGEIAQPWAEPPAKHTHQVTLAFSFHSQVRIPKPQLALERSHKAAVTLNGRPVDNTRDGWWVDRDIHTLALPELTPGDHRLEVTYPFGGAGGLEACYLLGDFGVTLTGQTPGLVAAVRELGFGDWTGQGLPFYGGNLTYHCHLTPPAGPWALTAPHFAAPLLSVDAQGQRVGVITHSPFRLRMPESSGGTMALDVTAFGSRVNTFGTLHNAKPNPFWWGPAAWRTTGRDWTDGYNLKRCGILVAPMIELRTE